ncbi:MAG TPA: hypothetical protein VF114_02635 [Candidatus Limnocylindria bacterium]
MSDAFDGAGEPYRGPSFKAGILLLLGIIVATFIIWNLASFGMELLNVGGPVDNPPVLPGAGK